MVTVDAILIPTLAVLTATTITTVSSMTAFNAWEVSKSGGLLTCK